MEFAWTKPRIYRDAGWWLCQIAGHVLGASIHQPKEAYERAVEIWYRLPHQSKDAP